MPHFSASPAADWYPASSPAVAHHTESIQRSESMVRDRQTLCHSSPSYRATTLNPIQAGGTLYLVQRYTSSLTAGAPPAPCTPSFACHGSIFGLSKSEPAEVSTCIGCVLLKRCEVNCMGTSISVKCLSVFYRSGICTASRTRCSWPTVYRPATQELHL
eukprot:366365-Chlamydomonas_euryale.AAC.7